MTPAKMKALVYEGPRIMNRREAPCRSRRKTWFWFGLKRPDMRFRVERVPGTRRTIPEAHSSTMIARYGDHGRSLSDHLQGALPAISLVSQTAFITASFRKSKGSIKKGGDEMPSAKIRVVLFDFDGTLSTLRAGWEEVMAPFMKECILGPHRPSEEEQRGLEAAIDAYIDQSTGIQTVYQMEWLAGQVRERAWNPVVSDIWEYKAEYNRRLLEKVNERIRMLELGKLRAEDYLMKGAVAFLQLLQDHGIEMYLASGTDHPDVVHEAEVLGVRRFFKEIAGAPVGRADCSKEKVIQELLDEKGFKGSELAVIGDGKVEVSLGKQKGALAIGLASNENKREGINPVKESRLLKAGADFIIGDFLDLDGWSGLFGW